jgi:hypothetical protein
MSRGSPESSAKTSPPPPFGGIKTVANDTSESALKQALKRPEIADLLK